MGSGNSALKHQLTDKQDASAELTQDCPGGRDSSGAMEDKKSRGARSDPESLADLRCQAETMWKSKLGNVELLDRQSYVELLQSVGHTFQEANILLKECPGSSYIRVKDFLDFLFASPKVDKEDVPTSLQSRDDGEKTEKAMIDSLQEALAASEKRADQQAQLLEELAEKVRQLQATQAHKQDALSPASLLLDKQKEMMEQALALQEQFEEDEALEEDEELQEEGGSKLKEEEKEEEVQDEEEKEKSSRRREVDQAKHWRFQGIAYGASGNFNEMKKKLLEKALALFHKHYEEEHPEIALTLIFLSKAYQSLKDHDMAKKELYEVGKILSFHKRLILPLRFTVKEGPSVLRYIEEATFLGRFKAGAKFIYASYPGKFKGGWHILVSDDGEYSEESVACVYCCTRQEGLGEHVPDRRDSKAPCYCRRIYGEGNPKNRNHITFGYLFEVGPPYDDAEHMKNARETAAAMNAVLVRKDASPKEYREAVEKAKKAWSDHGKRPAWGCKWYDVWFDNMEKGVDTGQKPVVVYYPNMVGLGKVSMEDLSNPDVPLWDSDSSNRGLGGSQKVEVATMDCMRQQHGPGSARDYIEMDVTTFMNLSLSVDDRIIGWNEDKGKWMSGVITRKGELEPRNKEDACFRWTVQVHESEECFETSRIRPDKGEMDGLEEKLVQKDFVRSLKKSLPKGQQLISTCPRKEWLQDGAPAMTFDIRSQDVASIQKLCSDVLCGDFEVSFNRAAFQHQTNTAGSPGEKIDYWQLQVNKTEFVKAYKSMLMSSTRLTPHQQDRLSKLDGSQHFHLKAAAGSGKTFVAAHKVVNTLLEKDEGRVLFVAPCKSLCLHFVRWLLAMDTGFGAEERICSRLKLMCEPYKSFMTVSVTDKKQLQLPEEKSSVEAQFILAVVDEAHDIFRSDVDQGLLKETLRRSNQCILLSDLSQSSAWDQNYHDLGHYDEVYLTQNVRSTERVVLGAKPFQLSPEHEQGDVVSIGSNGPPLKTYIFEREETGSPPFQEYCRHIIAALKHVVSSYPGLSFHHNVAIIVPDLDFLNSFQEHLKKALKEEIVQTTLSKRLGLISFEESLSYLVSPDAADEGSIEELILDSIGNAKGLEQLIVIVVGMDAQIKSQGDAHDLATRARLYQSITRAQLTAVVVNELLPDGWLAHLATCKLKEGQFQKQEAHMESDTAVATKLVQEIQARGPEERPAHREDPPLETIATALPNGSEEPAASAPSRSPSKPSAPPTEQKKTVIGMRPSSVWDTSQNSTPSPIYDLKFDPMKPQSAFKMLKSQLRQVPLPATCPCPEDVLVCWYNSADEKLSGGELQRRKRLYLFHRNGAFLRREDFWFFAASEASEDPELAARAVRGATRYIFEGRYAVAPAERRVTVTWDRRAFADCTGAAAAPREVRFGPWGAFGRGDGFVYDLEELSERSKRPGVKPLAWPDHQLSEETLKDLEEQRKKDGSWNPENLWFFTADLGGRHRGHV